MSGWNVVEVILYQFADVKLSVNAPEEIAPSLSAFTDFPDVSKFLSSSSLVVEKSLLRGCWCERFGCPTTDERIQRWLRIPSIDPSAYGPSIDMRNASTVH